MNVLELSSKCTIEDCCVAPCRFTGQQYRVVGVVYATIRYLTSSFLAPNVDTSLRFTEKRLLQMAENAELRARMKRRMQALDAMRKAYIVDVARLKKTLNDQVRHCNRSGDCFVRPVCRVLTLFPMVSLPVYGMKVRIDGRASTKYCAALRFTIP